MARTKTVIDQNRLISALETAEKDGPLSNLNELWKKTADIYNTDLIPEVLSPITFSVVMLRVAEMQASGVTLSIKTQKGRKGRPPSFEKKSEPVSQDVANTSSDNNDVLEDGEEVTEEEKELSSKLMVKQTPPKYRGLAERAHKSRSVALKLKCLDCCGWQRKEVANCTARTCPLWSWRPYQGKIKEESVVESGTKEETTVEPVISEKKVEVLAV